MFGSSLGLNSDDYREKLSSILTGKSEEHQIREIKAEAKPRLRGRRRKKPTREFGNGTPKF